MLDVDKLKEENRKLKARLQNFVEVAEWFVKHSPKSLYHSADYNWVIYLLELERKENK